MRCLYIHQKLLDQRVHSLWELLDAILSECIGMCTTEIEHVVFIVVVVFIVHCQGNDMEVAISDDSVSFTR